MDENKKSMIELVSELEEELAARGQSKNAIAQYHYIFQVFLAFFKSYQESYFSKELMQLCLKEHYGIDDSQFLSRRQSYKKKVVRASRMVEDLAEEKRFADRYKLPSVPLLTDSFNAAVMDFSAHLHEIGRSAKTIDAYQRNVSRFLSFVEQSSKLSLKSLTVEDVHNYAISLCVNINTCFAPHEVNYMGRSSPLEHYKSQGLNLQFMK